jgi:uncharacterized protein with NRDE domain
VLVLLAQARAPDYPLVLARAATSSTRAGGSGWWDAPAGLLAGAISARRHLASRDARFAVLTNYRDRASTTARRAAAARCQDMARAGGPATLAARTTAGVYSNFNLLFSDGERSASRSDAGGGRAGASVYGLSDLLDTPGRGQRGRINSPRARVPAEDPPLLELHATIARRPTTSCRAPA